MEIKKMSNEELREALLELRLRRKTGYAPRKKSSPKTPSEFDGISPEIAEKILAALLEGSENDDTECNESEDGSGDDGDE